jgi:hypothetical protein
MEHYRLFFVYRIKDLNYIHVHGMNMKDKKLFTVLIASPKDELDLTGQADLLPKALLEVLYMESDRINSGLYDLAHWEPISYR